MKFVYFGYDLTLPGILHLMNEGHELLGIFGFECDNIFNFNIECQKLTQAQAIPFIISPAEDFHLQSFLDKGAEAFLAVGYPHKIPPIDENRAFAVNIHPAYLPRARGIMPIPRIIMDHVEDAAGISAHKMTQHFDAGDILLQSKIDLDQRETVESYTKKLSILSPDFLSELMNNLPTLWQNATPQDKSKASWFKAPTDQERFLNWQLTVNEIDHIGRAFGRFGSLANINGELYIVYDYDFRQEEHDLTPGKIAARTQHAMTIAAKDGFICLREFQPAGQPIS